VRDKTTSDGFAGTPPGPQHIQTTGSAVVFTERPENLYIIRFISSLRRTILINIFDGYSRYLCVVILPTATAVFTLIVINYKVSLYIRDSSSSIISTALRLIVRR